MIFELYLNIDIITITNKESYLLFLYGHIIQHSLWFVLKLKKYLKRNIFLIEISKTRFIFFLLAVALSAYIWVMIDALDIISRVRVVLSLCLNLSTNYDAIQKFKDAVLFYLADI